MTMDVKFEWDSPAAEEYYLHLQKLLNKTFQETYGSAPANAATHNQRARRAYESTDVIRRELQRVYTDHCHPIAIVPKVH